MSEVERNIPISEVLGDRNGFVKVEESWNKDVPVEIGANAVADKPFNREKSIEEAVARGSRRLMVGAENHAKRLKQEMAGSVNGNQGVVPTLANLQHHFFVVKGKKMEYLGSKECLIEKFKSDISGRFFREWLKQSFPGRQDYEDICAWNDGIQLKEIVELLKMCEV